VTIVKYRKSEVLVSAQAIGAIESHVKWIGVAEVPWSNPIKTTPAYAADE
jgi:hypothetical protein